MTRKFQATIPKEVRKLLGLDKGDLLVFLRVRGEIVLKKGAVTVNS
jgi:AbrB family looped-hinge helix DNA binding protein